MALRGIAFQSATIVGPAIGGLLFAARGGELVYAVAAALFVARARLRPPCDGADGGAAPGGDSSREALFAGARFVRRTPVLFGAISLDLFAVLFGGAMALLPLFAKSILDIGPVGLGILRSAPAVGALVAGIILAHRPIRGNAGRTLLIVVAIFGAAHDRLRPVEVVPALRAPRWLSPASRTCSA